MSVRVATVLSAREWEPDLVAYAREHAALRIVLRAFQPDEIATRRDEIDVVVAGAETAWVTPSLLATWRRHGLTIVGIYPVGDRPGADLLAAGGADEILADNASSESIVSAIRHLTFAAGVRMEQGSGRVVAVLGPRGAPGSTEVAVAVAMNQAGRSRSVLVDLDLAAPALAIRLGLAPRPDVTDAADAVRSEGQVPERVLRHTGKLDIIVGSHRPGEPPLRDAMAEDVVEALIATHDHVYLDLGAVTADSLLVKRADDAVVVIDGSAVGIVRAAQLTAAWAGPPPLLVINRVAAKNRAQVVEAVRHWTGLDPVAVLTDRSAVRSASLSAKAPDRRFRRGLRGVA